MICRMGKAVLASQKSGSATHLSVGFHALTQLTPISHFIPPPTSIFSIYVVLK